MCENKNVKKRSKTGDKKWSICFAWVNVNTFQVWSTYRFIADRFSHRDFEFLFPIDVPDWFKETFLILEGVGVLSVVTHTYA